MADEAPLLALMFTFSLEELKSGQEAINDEYCRLLKACRDVGLAIVGKRSRTPGTIVVFVDCHDEGRKNAIVSWEGYVRRPASSDVPEFIANRMSSQPAPIRPLRAHLMHS